MTSLWHDVEKAVADASNNGEGRASAYYLEYHFMKEGLAVYRIPDRPETLPDWPALATGHCLEKQRLQDGNARVGKWLSAALDDPDVCAEMKADIREWFRCQEYKSRLLIGD